MGVRVSWFLWNLGGKQVAATEETCICPISSKDNLLSKEAERNRACILLDHRLMGLSLQKRLLVVGKPTFEVPSLAGPISAAIQFSFKILRTRTIYQCYGECCIYRPRWNSWAREISVVSPWLCRQKETRVEGNTLFNLNLVVANLRSCRVACVFVSTSSYNWRG